MSRIMLTMMLTVLCVVASAVESSDSARGDVLPTTNLGRNTSAHQLQGIHAIFHFVVCRVSIRKTIYEADVAGGETNEQNSVVCIPMVHNATEQAIPYEIVLPAFIASSYQSDLKAGILFLNISDATLNDSASAVVVGPLSEYTVVQAPPDYLRRMKRQSIGVKSFAMMRVSTTDATPAYTMDDLRNVMFGDGINVMTQLRSCSFGALRFKATGMYDISLNESITGFGNSSTNILKAALDQTVASLQLSSATKIADVIIACLPPGTGTGSWVSSSTKFHLVIQITSGWCLSLSVAMQVLGHGMGIDDESNEIRYDNATTTTKEITHWPQRCYDGASSLQLAWFRSRTLRCNPLRDGPRIVKLVASTDFLLSSIDEFVLVNIADRWVLQYNRAKQFNIDTTLFPDKITVTAIGVSNFVAVGLGVGDELLIPDDMGDGTAFRIMVCSSIVGTESTLPDVMIVIVTLATITDMTCGPRSEALTPPSSVPISSLSVPPTLALDSYHPTSLNPIVTNSEAPSTSPTPTIPIMEPISFFWRSVKVAAVSGAVSAALGGLVCCLMNNV